MFSGSGRQRNDYNNQSSRQRYIGKVQFLKADFGYIRSRSKINGIRDITFNYLDVPISLRRELQVGDHVSFRVTTFSSGKFCAVDIRRDDQTYVYEPIDSTTRSSSPTSSLLSAEVNTDEPYAVEITNKVEKPSLDAVFPTLSVVTHDFSSKVDIFFEKVISRRFDPSYSSCWLQF